MGSPHFSPKAISFLRALKRNNDRDWFRERNLKVTIINFQKNDDAISAYARGGSYSMTQPGYAQQCALIRRDRWEKCRTLRLPSVTFASAGWDTRPRNERPPFWMKEVTATPDPTAAAQQKPLLDAVTATPDELAAHIKEAIAWTRANRDLNPANAVIIYGWNEHDEGGWLQPTLGPDGQPDVRRIEALGMLLRPETEQGVVPKSKP
ncbi:MAG: hypothetical protein EBS05_13895 [Proteobacteria bacterium]|nr:hypothetical protein [Pseudomonadota bacterium]